MTRYQSGPGQASAYMIGQLTIQKLRDYAEEELKESFNLKEFHYQVKMRAWDARVRCAREMCAWDACVRFVTFYDQQLVNKGSMNPFLTSILTATILVKSLGKLCSFGKIVENRRSFCLPPLLTPILVLQRIIIFHKEHNSLLCLQNNYFSIKRLLVDSQPRFYANELPGKSHQAICCMQAGTENSWVWVHLESWKCWCQNQVWKQCW